MRSLRSFSTSRWTRGASLSHPTARRSPSASLSLSSSLLSPVVVSARESLLGSSRRSACGASRLLACDFASSRPTSAAALTGAPLASESFLTGTSAAYVEQMYNAWQRDPSSVHASWNAYFTNVLQDLPAGASFCLPPSAGVSSGLLGSTTAVGGAARGAPFISSAPGSLPAGASFVTPESLPVSPQQSVHDTSRLIQMVRGYQMRGHEIAAVNPLSLPQETPFVSGSRGPTPAGTLDFEAYGFTKADLDKVYDCRVDGMCGFLSPEFPPRPLRQIIQRLEEAYCGSVGVEYMHIGDRNVCNFIRQWIETPAKYGFTTDMKKKILARTARSQMFENFCGQKFSTSKRFGLDGCETMIVAMKAITKKAAREGVNSVVIGMPHRGRLNVLVNVLHKPMQQLLSEFLGVTSYSSAEWGNSGDVKYHLGVEFDHFDADAQRYIHMGVLANPSHLEAVDPLVIGQARAQQYYSEDEDSTKVLPVILHGDASVAGQGVVYETLQMSQLPNYRVGGTIHIVVNNQIGFTTNPVDSSSGRYCTDIAKALDAPVFHVNADDPEAVTFVSELALEYRQRFKGDVFIDLIGYRRLGHNELDMPKFTQPRMYNLISKKKSVFDIYSERLLNEGVVTEADLQQLKQNILAFYNAEYEKCRDFLPSQQYEYSPQWKHLVRPDVPAAPQLTGVPLDRLRELGTKIFTLPPDFNVHPTVGKIYKERLNAIQAAPDENLIDFGTAENLCYATLLSDGFHVRIAGQDVQRGTFSHRHAVLHDQTTFEPYSIFDSLKCYGFPHKIQTVNSPLSEYAAMGYELGYSLEHPDSLCIWEAQFGDFANGAQIIIDQFIASGEVKWNKQTGIVVMLPHGYDGQGPEHSSGRIERILQLCDDREDVIHHENWELEKSSIIQQHNLQVIMPSTPANTFHALRRQVHREFRKPLIIFSPKRMLKMRAAMCTLNQLNEGTRFRRYIPDKTAEPEKVTRLIACSGQVYYDLIAGKDKMKNGDENGDGDKIAIARMEQLSPFPFDLFIEDLKRFPNLKSVVWAQEEPMNQGAWFYTSKRIESSLRHLNFPNGIRSPIYAGRDVCAATAVGDKKLHDQELAQLLQDALDINRTTHSYLEKYLHKQENK
ncbi:putative 2-oxoglutarate dehydrogenase e1 component, mitochondrial precursor [Toxoplasma gondii TgCatPRC2]|uniref:2-oxoglutarate dehydrogenase, mitochondrial n=2 Tax=Toxoplasma gondii TaxID=5811 RepID=A0A151HRI9_TOXGO|nr:2-oxoglutarate dehydrogenase e1 component, mitochondrial precursor, putative [Toxoplasma gondii ME49]EPT30542.1 2-oxoglutarate dehydrogenase e1 component, mitochondrial precursor, putative [Toxoplasma gondii ME49]KYK72035.1 putative 2-oxoglutarate dehydrogenase e1 component, mitochondrial precursor [Toxoplasma gondii TgCatPRC2]|eukprot:XP_002366909.1 2-oxoglutarate dehydrogenase e1 component, mitochondrial precursor, putative [Toxoplasma gondii ME49]